ncbi:hypothetical protein EYC80_004518 [Monilinia laxa]|uniref:SUI1 domain-containing protein n=1 Tax=Monilinia laxa TaxID=61186 RepID=A0A5N6KHA6_MONLA|nr:hypothetical protein EYC80_004518 [Monilinia laxa]
MSPPTKSKQINNSGKADSFANAGTLDLQSSKYIDVRAQQIRGQAKHFADGSPKFYMVTTISGLPSRFDKRSILSVMKKKWGCAGTIIDDRDCGEIIQLQGDLRAQVLDFLLDRNGLELSRDVIQIHDVILAD